MTFNSNVKNEKIKSIEGGLSGEPLMEKSTRKLSYIRSISSEMPLIGVGGIFTKQDFDRKINAGASLVQVYTGFIVKGPSLINEILSS